MRTRERIEQQLVRVEPVAGVRLVRSVDTIAVDGAGPEPLDVAVPDFVAEFGKRDPLHLGASRGVEEAELDFRGVRREEAEVDARFRPTSHLADGACLRGSPG